MDEPNASMTTLDIVTNGTSLGMTWNNSTSVEQLLLNNLGPKRLPLNWIIPLTAVYAVIFLTGLVGNICTCLVIARNQYMQTPTNCYLFNLAIADMLTLLIAMPLELYTLWQQYPWDLGYIVCEIRTIIPECTAYASILTIVTFSMERYIAICHPIRQQTKSTLRQAIWNIIAIWFLSFLCALPFGFFTGINYLERNNSPILESAWCGLPFNDPREVWAPLMLYSTIVFFVLPITIITVLYLRIALTLHQSRTLHRGASESAHTEAERSKAQSRKMVVRMLVAVVIAFFVCWAPFHAQRLLFVYVSLKRNWTEKLRTINQDLFSIAGCFYYFNSTVNPILYSVMSNRFRVAFREKLCAGPPSLWCICCCCFCCVKDFEKRSQRTVIYRNSNSHSSVRSYVSYPANNNKPGSNNNNNSLPRVRSLGVDFNEKQGVAMSWVRNNDDQDVAEGFSSSSRKFGNTLTISPSLRNSRHSDSNASSRSSKSIEKKSTTDSSSSGKDIEDEEEAEKTELMEELDEAIRPELDKLAESDKGCVNCTNCTLLFPPKSNKNAADAPDKSVASEVTYLECSGGRYSPEIRESIV